jgi:hypothetical protein
MGFYGGTTEASKSYLVSRSAKQIVAGDINGDCKVDFKDFAIMASHWLEDGSEPLPPDVKVVTTTAAGLALLMLLLSTTLVPACSPRSANETSPTTSVPPAAASPTTTPTVGALRGPGVSGTLAKIAGKSLTLTSPQGNITVTVNTDTTYQQTKTTTIAALKTGQSLTVIGNQDASGNAIWWWENPYPDFSKPWTCRHIKSSGGNKHHDQTVGKFLTR